MRLLMLGGTRFLGRHVCEQLLAAGAEVTVLHRGETAEPPVGAESVIGDRSRDDGLEAVAGRRFDAVLDLSGYQAAWVRRAAEALAGRVGHYAFVSSGAVYRPVAELPWPEHGPLGPIPIWGRYGVEKLEAERRLREAHDAGRLAVSIHRYPFILGPGNFVDREAFVLARLAAGRPILLPGGGTAINQFVHVADAARGLVAALERPDVAVGQAWNCAYRTGVTNRGFVELCADVVGASPRIVDIDVDELDVASPVFDLADVLFPFPDEHYLLDGTKLGRELDAAPRVPPRRMLEEFAAWWEGVPDHAPRRYAREERVLAKLERRGALG